MHSWFQAITSPLRPLLHKQHHLLNDLLIDLMYYTFACKKKKIKIFPNWPSTPSLMSSNYHLMSKSRK